MLPEYDVLNPRLDYLSLEERVKLQGKRLRAQVQHCYENAPFWRKKFNDAGITPDDIKGLDDLQKIPFCTKHELQKDQEENPPFEGKVADGYVWGRGALDMKSVVAMMLAAFLRAKAEGLTPAGDIVLAFTVTKWLRWPG